MIKKISRISNIGVFHNFSWDSSKVDEFAKFNAFYGWNGSGKTTLSRLISILETGTTGNLQLEDESECVFQTDQGNIEVSKENLPPLNKNIKVFNEDFVNENLEWTKAKASRILIVGKTKIDQKSSLEKSRKLREKKEADLITFDSNLSIFEKEKDKILERVRISVVSELSHLTDLKPLGGRASQYRTYNVIDVGNLLKDSSKVFPVFSDEEKLDKKNALTEKEEKAQLNDYVANLGWLEGFPAKVVDILSTSLSSQVSTNLEDEIAGSDDLREWLRTGHGLHRNLPQPVICKFCRNEISQDRLTNLDKYFDEAQRRLMIRIYEALRTLTDTSIPVPEQAEKLYKEFEKEYSKQKEAFFIEKSNLESGLTSLKTALQKKQKRPFEKPTVDIETLDTALGAFRKSVEDLNAVIAKHNEKTKQFATRREKAAHDLELFLVGQVKVDFDEKDKSIKGLQESREKLQKEINDLKTGESNLEQQLRDHGIGATEFNKLLKSFLGRSEITFNAVDEGYLIVRNGRSATNLSEGERNAIALVFFLTKLQEDGFEASKGVIVIDDPVSSFDSQHVYQAYGFIKAKIKEIDPQQFFLLTHNFHFFRQIRNWYKHEDGKVVCLYMIKCKTSPEDQRFSTIENLDSLLQNHNSEYAFLFKLVYERSRTEEDPPLEQDYIFPNVIRKLLENYLSLKVPIGGINIHGKFMRILADYPGYEISRTTKERLESYCQDNSHPLYQDSSMDFDERLMGEMQPACKDLISLIEHTDPKHYQHLISQLQT